MYIVFYVVTILTLCIYLIYIYIYIYIYIQFYLDLINGKILSSNRKNDINSVHAAIHSHIIPVLYIFSSCAPVSVQSIRCESWLIERFESWIKGEFKKIILKKIKMIWF